MRDDVVGLGFLKSAEFAPRAPLPPRSAATSRPNTNASFASQLNRATLKKYSSPLAGPKNAQAQTTRPTTTSTALQRARMATPAKPSTSTQRTQSTPSSPAQRPAPTTTTPRSTLTSPLTSLDVPHTSLDIKPKSTAAPTTLGSVTGSTSSTSSSAARTSPSITSRPDTWPRLDPSHGSSTAQPLAAYPRPVKDNGRGLHWIPTTKQEPAVVDKFVAEAQHMGVKWVTFLNNGATIGDNEYLVKKLTDAGIEPVMRIYSPTLQPLQGDIEGMVRHYTALGVHYYQPFNEPNLNCENPDGKVSVDRYLDAWIPAAKAIERGGGLAGFGALAPGGDYDDQQFLKDSLDGLKSRGELETLDKGWIAMHNYTWNHPIADRGDGDGFFKFRAYQKMVNAALGRDLPIVGTEGGTFVGQQEDPKMPAVTASMAADWTNEAFTYMRDKREPWLFASSVWTVANEAGGASDARFEAQALFRSDGTTNSIVSALRSLAA